MINATQPPSSEQLFVTAGPVHFADGLPGFPALHEFQLLPLDANPSPFGLLRSEEVAGLELVVAAPAALVEDYVVELSDEHIRDLELSDARDAVVMVVLTLAAPPGVPTANLLAPVVINRRNGRAAQVVLHDSGYAVAVPLTLPTAE